MLLSPGTRLGPYEVTAVIGSGGMGEVYKAVDTRLGRTVAIKVSATEFSERFEREARSVAALNHQNICQLYDVGPNYLVMEYIEGQPAGRVESPRKLLDLAVQMADGMAAAHAAGLVHRDLKPDNILVTTDGRAKILDFGLAKVARDGPDNDGLTRTAGLTDPGTTLGTVAYMSPEQARGDPNLGPQSDQFSLGLVLYEMLTGQRAFRRDSTAETMTAIIREEPDPLPSSVPAPLRWVIERLLSKDPVDRYESSRDLYRELRQIRDRLSQATSVAQIDAAAPAASPLLRRRLMWGTGLVVAGLVAGAGLVLGLPFAARRDTAAPDLSRYRFTPISVETPTEREPAWSPDGRSIAYTASINGVLQVMTRPVGGSQAAQLTHRMRNAVRPFWSPDGSTLYFTSQADDGVGVWLWSVNATGGTPEPVIEGASSAAVHPDGRTFAFAKDGKLWIGGDPRADDAPAREFGAQPSPGRGGAEVQAFSPDGSTLAVVAEGDVWVLAYPSGEARRFPALTNDASWMPDSRRLVIPTIDGANMTLSMLDTGTGDLRTFYASAYSLLNPAISPDGRRLAFMGGDSTWELVEVQIPGGRVRTMPSAGGVSWWPAWAPSGTHYAFVSDRLERAAVRDVNSDSAGAFSRVLAEVDDGGGSLAHVRWAPDGNRFTFTVNRRQGAVLMIANASGSPPQPVDTGADTSRQGVWSPDGQWLVYQRHVGGDEQLVKIRPGSRSEPETLKTWPAANPAGAARTPVDWSSDGRWILAVRGQPGIFLISPDGAVERQISSRGGSRRAALGFAHDARSLIYLEQNTGGEGAPWRLWSIDVATGAERLTADVPLPETAGDVAGFSLHPDGTRFLTSIAKWPFDIWMLEGFDE
jgi:Tol biopolymer transport system component/predicted Ser/Thr protein kinase